MMRSEEGKLLAGAAGFYSPWGSESDEQGHRLLLGASLSCNKEVASHRLPVPAFGFTPIRVREKKNECS
jgi:hypothetical protein